VGELAARRALVHLEPAVSPGRSEEQVRPQGARRPAVRLPRDRLLVLPCRRPRVRDRLRAVRAAEPPRHEHERRDDCDPGEGEEDDAGLDPAVLTPPGARPARLERRLLLADEEAGVVLVDVELAVEAEVLRVRPQEALDVRRARQLLELLLLERAQVLATDLRGLLELGELEPLAQARLAE